MIFLIDNSLYRVLSDNMSFILPEIFIGTWQLAGDYWGEQKHSDSLKMLHAALREGYHAFDTSPDYGKGKSELLLGQQLKNSKNIYISTKSFLKPISSFSKGIENSFKRLNCNYIDSFFIHWPSTKFNLREPLELLNSYKKDGKIGSIGVSNFNKEQLIEAQNICNIDVVQNAYNLLWINDQDYFIYCKESGIKTQAYSTLAQGLLTGKFNLKNPVTFNDHRNKMVLYSKDNLKLIYTIIEELEEIATKNKISTTKLTLAWILEKPFIDSIIVGCRNRSQLEALKSLQNIKLSKEDIGRLNTISESFKLNNLGVSNIFNHSY